MSRDWLVNIITGVLLLLLAIFWIVSYAKLKEENIVLKSDNAVLQSQIKNIQEAAAQREVEYQKIEADYNKLNEQMEELKDEESINWLDGAIPNAVDDTIPY